MDDGRLEQLRTHLEQQREDLRRELRAHGADPESDDVAFVDDSGFADRSHSTEERSRLISVTLALRANLREVEAALGKMEAGTYGVCERCGRSISDDRLEAIPSTPLCIDCKRLADA